MIKIEVPSMGKLNLQVHGTNFKDYLIVNLYDREMFLCYKLRKINFWIY